MRENSTRTVQISASLKTNGAGPGGVDANGHKPAAFLAATPDGATVFFESCEQLTNDSTAVSTAADNTCLTPDQGQDLYRYDTATGDLTDLTVDTHAGDAKGAQVQGMLGTSADGSYAYFVANGVLAPGGAPGDCDSTGQGLVGTCNLYVLHGATTTFIASLGENGATPQVSDLQDWQPSTTSVGGARVAADGPALFSSTMPLTGYDNTGPRCDHARKGPGPCEELFRFDPAADGGKGALDCVSCSPTGAPALDNADLINTQQVGAGFLNDPGPGHETRNLSADGSRVFFETPLKLVPADVNGDGGCPTVYASTTGACQDVYEWEAEGSGSCHSHSQNDGCLYLLSSGTSSEPSFLDDASTSGNDAFIFTYDQLVPQDTDQLSDLYDVRVDGGLASQHQVSRPPCGSDTCQGAASATPTLPLAATVTFVGPGDATPPLGDKVSVGKIKPLSGPSAKLRVTVPQGGVISISGASFHTATKTALKAGTYTVAVTLTAKAKRTLKRRHRLRATVRVSLKPSTGAASAITVALTFNQPTAARHAKHNTRAAGTTWRTGR